MESDWRFQGQEKYLLGLRLIKRSYKPSGEHNDHDHCEFCYEKFMSGGINESLSEGYASEDGYRWVCEKCYNDFKEMFKWQ